MARKRYPNYLLAGGAVLVAAGVIALIGGGGAPALSQQKVGHGVSVTVYESPT